jgi:hypothetical protein
MGDAVQSLSGRQQFRFSRGGSVQRVLNFGEFRRHFWSSHPKSIPEAFSWLQRQPRSSRDLALSRAGKQA